MTGSFPSAFLAGMLALWPGHRTQAQAQAPAQAQGPAPPAATGAPSPPGAPADPADRRIERRLALLHERLAITPAQEPQWGDFARVLQGNADRITDMVERQQPKLAGMSATQSLGLYADLARVHAENMARMSDAFGRLYAVLSDAQRRTADEAFRTDRARIRGNPILGGG